jgi:predicted GNAT family acetyltransferase
MAAEIKDNTAQSRFELVEQGHTAYANYRLEGPVLAIKYVFSPEELRGQGTAGRLMEGIAKKASAENLKIMPICGYAASWLRKHKEHHDLIA